MEIKSLSRTFAPTFNAYSYDGAGRDMYIGYNNGGFWNSRIPPGTPFESTTSMSTRYRIRGIPNEVAPFKYYSDGSGRDSYIILNSGGLKRDTKPLKGFKLKDILRVPEDCIFEYKPRIESKKVTYISRRQMENNKYLQRNEKGIIQRLYTKEKQKFLPTENNMNQKFNDTSMLPSLAHYNQFKLKRQPQDLINGIDQINSFERNKQMKTLSTQKNRNTYLHYTNLSTSPY